ncbi:MAG TPA: trypsin-like peptidase domain-containing protein [Microlunatus sp.]|nr:trypsin-like peptidase domain-containing protein [Microlunatus sp.]
MRGDISTNPTSAPSRRLSRYRALTRTAAATVAAAAIATGGALVVPAQAAPITTETRLAEQTNPAVQVITTEYRATVKLGRIQFSKAGQQLVLRAYVKYLHGDFGAAGFVSYIFDRAQRDPAQYLTETGKKRTQKLGAQFVGSGFIATPDGYVVTARHVVTPDSQVKKMFAQAGASAFAKADATALLKDFAKFDLSTGAMKSIVRTVNGFAQAKVHVDLGQPKVAVRLGVASATGQRIGQNQPAEVVFRSDPALGADVAVLRIRVDGQLPTVPLGTESPQQGEQVYINAFPAAATYLKDFSKASQLQPTLTQGSITALKNTAGGTPILQTDANAMPGSSGGAAFDEKGQVVGMLVSGAVDANGSGVGQNYLMPLDVITDALTRSGAKPATSETTAIYNQALADFHDEYYSKALGEFQQVKALFPAHAYVGGFITKAQTAINQGQDKTPPPAEPGFSFSFGTPMIITGIALVVIIGLGVSVLIVVARRRRPANPAPENAAGYGLLPGGAPANTAQPLPQQNGLAVNNAAGYPIVPPGFGPAPMPGAPMARGPMPGAPMPGAPMPSVSPATGPYVGGYPAGGAYAPPTTNGSGPGH